MSTIFVREAGSAADALAFAVLAGAPCDLFGRSRIRGLKAESEAAAGAIELNDAATPPIAIVAGVGVPIPATVTGKIQRRALARYFERFERVAFGSKPRIVAGTDRRAEPSS